MNVYVCGSTADKKPSFNVTSLGDRRVDFAPCVSGTEHITIDHTSPYKSVNFTELRIGNMVVYGTGGDSVEFNQLNLSSVHLDEATFRNVNMTVRDLYCDYEDLA